MIRYFQRLWQSIMTGTPVDKKICTYTLLFFIVSLATPNNKFFFLLAACYVAIVFLHTKSAGATFLYGFFALQMYFIGQRHEFLIIPPEELQKNTLYPNGRYLYYTVTPLLILTMAASFSMPFQLLKSVRLPQLPRSLVGFGLLYLVSLISAMSSQLMPTLAVLYTLDNIFLFGWVITTYCFLRCQPKRTLQILLTTTFIIIILSVSIETSVTSLQYIKRGLLGLNIEGTRSIAPFGFGPDENPLQFRPVGLTPHANALSARSVALFYAILLITNVLSVKKGRRKVKYFSWFGAALCLFTIVLTQSRIGYASLLFPLAGLAFFHRAAVSSLLRELYKKVTPYLLYFVPFIAVASFILVDRLLYLQYVFAESAGWKTRLLLIQEAIKLIVRYPFLGVGTGMFIPAAFNEQRYDDTPGISIMRYFPEGVHNGYLLLTAENGIVSLLVLILIIFLIVRELKGRRFTFSTKSLILAGILANLIFMTAQPTSMNFPVNILAYYFVGIYLYGKRLHT